MGLRITSAIMTWGPPLRTSAASAISVKSPTPLQRADVIVDEGGGGRGCLDYLRLNVNLAPNGVEIGAWTVLNNN